jgi:hypothetical protein
MASYIKLIKKEKRPRFRSFRDDITKSKDPDFFKPTGTQVYCGQQGSGKTISAVKHVHDLKFIYPKSIIVSNLVFSELTPREFHTREQLHTILTDFDPLKQYILFTNIDQLGHVLTMVNNGFFGVIYLIDEIHTYFNALESKNIPPYIFTEISQQRKQRKCIIGTSQLFLRMAKPFREQCDNIIICNTLMGFITTQRAYDGMSITQDYDGKLSGSQRRLGWFFHTPKIRAMFDTYQKIQSGQIQFEDTRNNTVIEQKKGFSLSRR